MKRKMARLTALILLLLLILVGCGSNGTVTLNEVGEVSLLNEKMANYLVDEITRVGRYASGIGEKSYPNPVVLEWTLEGAKADSYVVRIGEKEDLSDAWELAVTENKAEIYNCKTGTDYYWSVTALSGKKTVGKSAVSTFTTAAGAPRTIYCDGVANMRDVGGWATESGVPVQQGLIYRCGRLNENNNATVKARITKAGLQTMRELGIRTELDLRKVDNNEVGGLTDTSLIEGAQYVQVPMESGIGSLREENEAAVVEVFKLLGDEENYPFIIHCSIGTDRTGYIVYLINGLLGVSYDDLNRDYLLSNFGAIGSSRSINRIQGDYLDYMNGLPGDALSQKIEGYLLSIGVAQSDIDTVRRMMLG